MTGLVPSHRHLQPGKDILKAKRSSLADETFEMLMFMRGNKHHVTVFLRIF
jgi:hypothetical protein